MANLVLFITFASLLALIVSGGLAMYVAGEKGISTTKGFLIGFFLPIVGIVYVALLKSSDKQIAREMYDRSLISRNDLDQTVEFIKKG